MNRSKNSMMNITAGLISKMILMLAAFAVRTLFIKYLGAEYNGLNSLFLNILSILSLAEFGIGNVLMYSLYSALKENETEKIIALTYEFKRIYKMVIAVILSFGLIVVLFLPIIVNSSININNVILYYLLSLINSVSTYFVVYRTMVINADQKNYIITIITTVSMLLMYCFQIISLVLFGSFLVYLLIQLVFNIMNNYVLNSIAIHKYPYLKELKSNSIVINRKEMFKDIKATFIYKISDTILDQTDNIIISIMFGTLLVGFYANYFFIITYLVNVAAIIANGLVASFGNLNTENNSKKSYEYFKSSMFAFALYGAVCSVGYVCCIQDFISLWIGDYYLMNYSFIFSIIFVFYLRMVTNSMWMYRISMGLFKEVQYMSFVSAIINIILSIILGIKYGISGVIIATAIARLTTTFWFEGKVLFKKLNVKFKYYLLRQLKDFLLLMVSLICSFAICKVFDNITNNHLLLFFIKSITSIIITSLFFLIAYWKSNEINIILSRISSVVKKTKSANFD